MSATASNVLQPHDIRVLRHVYYQTGLSLLFYGMQSTLTVATVSILATKEGRSRWMLAAIVALFVSSTVEAALMTVFYPLQMPGWLGNSLWTGEFVAFMNRINAAIAVFKRLNYIMSDTIVVWRAWILWPDSRFAKGALLVCMCGSVVGAVTDCVWILKPIGVYQVSNARTLMITIPLLLTNLVATTLIGARIWCYRRDIKSGLGLSKRTQVESVLRTTLGSLLRIASIVFLVLSYISRDDTLSLLLLTGVVIHNIAGIYPTIVILIVAYGRKAQTELRAQVSHDLRFALSLDVLSERIHSSNMGIAADSVSLSVLSNHDEDPQPTTSRSFANSLPGSPDAQPMARD
ncbi:uncharacterized protein SCHCODRAFT_01146212 [Schizophyllum commune H4-8]|nr:uncharacterized protein SCHCODRAFT_01146212 [Schizophyllum commune H4-8]KAI5899679.1 hypothetical protein SCHCODRAFT_01146212 [Schizophyllum commune H4-8]